MTPSRFMLQNRDKLRRNGPHRSYADLTLPMHALLTIKRLNSLYVVIGKLDVLLVTFVPRVHDGFSHVGMFQTQTVSKLVNCHPVQVDAVLCSCGESLTIVKMRVARQAWYIEEKRSLTLPRFSDSVRSDAKKINFYDLLLNNDLNF